MLATLVLAVVVQSPPVASTPADPGLERGVVLVEKGDAAAAVAELDGAVRRLSAERRFNELARAHLYLGAAYVLLGQDQAARASFKAAPRCEIAFFASASISANVFSKPSGTKIGS